MIFELAKMQEQLFKIQKLINHWKMHGYDTPILTYHEQLEIYEEQLLRLKNKIIKEMK